MAPETEIKRFGTPLNGTDTLIFKSWHDLELSKITYIQQFDNQPENVLFHWRARVVYDPVTVPYQSHGPSSF